MLLLEVNRKEVIELENLQQLFEYLKVVVVKFRSFLTAESDVFQNYFFKWMDIEVSETEKVFSLSVPRFLFYPSLASGAFISALSVCPQKIFFY